MILLLGGTGETARIAEALAHAGFKVLVSTATEIPLFVGDHPNIAHRIGRLTGPEMEALVRKAKIRAIVDATHPYAAEVRCTAPRVAALLKIEYLTFIRPAQALPNGVLSARNHEEAARIACNRGGVVLLTIGSKNIAHYAREAFLSNTVLVVRVLLHSDSIDLCQQAGIPRNRIITGRGPFSIEDNRRIIQKFGVRTLVAKNSGAAGGLAEKLEAARLEGCMAVIVNRPQQLPVCSFGEIKSLIEELSIRIKGA